MLLSSLRYCCLPYFDKEKNNYVNWTHSPCRRKRFDAEGDVIELARIFEHLLQVREEADRRRQNERQHERRQRYHRRFERRHLKRQSIPTFSSESFEFSSIFITQNGWISLFKPSTI